MNSSIFVNKPLNLVGFTKVGIQENYQQLQSHAKHFHKLTVNVFSLNKKITYIYLLKVDNGKTWNMWGICSIKTSECLAVNFEEISHVVLMFLLLTLNKYIMATMASTHQRIFFICNMKKKLFFFASVFFFCFCNQSPYLMRDEGSKN